MLWITEINSAKNFIFLHLNDVERSFQPDHINHPISAKLTCPILFSPFKFRNLYYPSGANFPLQALIGAVFVSPRAGIG